jgi:FkbM family methyltransferase
MVATTSWPDICFAPRRVCPAEGVEFFLHPHTGEFDFEVLFRKKLKYEAGVFAVLARKSHRYDAVVEIGANVGVYTLFFSAMLAANNPAARVFAFEPSNEAYARLRANVEINPIDNVHAFNCAVGSCPGFATFYEPKGHLTNGSFLESFARSFARDVRETPVLTVDGPMIGRLVGGARNVLLKIDVEGAEATVLQSLTPFIEERRPDIIVEVLEGFDEAIAAVPVVKDRYRYFSISDDGRLEPLAFLKAVPGCRDYFLEPRD